MNPQILQFLTFTLLLAVQSTTAEKSVIKFKIPKIFLERIKQMQEGNGQPAQLNGIDFLSDPIPINDFGGVPLSSLDNSIPLVGAVPLNGPSDPHHVSGALHLNDAEHHLPLGGNHMMIG